MSAKRKNITLWERADKIGWTYSGDISLEHGGTFWKWDGDPDYVEAVRVTPCSDVGGPDNLFCIETGSIYFPSDDVKTRNAMLDTIGWYDHAAYGPYPLWAIVEAAQAYGGIERDQEHIVRIGAVDQFWTGHGWNPKPDEILPGNARLDNYVFREHLN